MFEDDAFLTTLADLEREVLTRRDRELPTFEDALLALYDRCEDVHA